jgi:hypothetical protein
MCLQARTRHGGHVWLMRPPLGKASRAHKKTYSQNCAHSYCHMPIPVMVGMPGSYVHHLAKHHSQLRATHTHSYNGAKSNSIH